MGRAQFGHQKQPMNDESDYFSDRERGLAPRIAETIQNAAWGGIVTTILRRISDGSLGAGFPEMCPDPEKQGIIGTN